MIGEISDPWRSTKFLAAAEANNGERYVVQAISLARASLLAGAIDYSVLSRSRLTCFSYEKVIPKGYLDDLRWNLG
jgi:hypothetical protein